jgi:cytochrome b561
VFLVHATILAGDGWGWIHVFTQNFSGWATSKASKPDPGIENIGDIHASLGILVRLKAVLVRPKAHLVRPKMHLVRPKAVLVRLKAHLVRPKTNLTLLLRTVWGGAATAATPLHFLCLFWPKSFSCRGLKPKEDFEKRARM